MHKLVPIAFLTLCVPIATLAQAPAPSMAEHQAELVAQCPAFPQLTEAEADALPIHVTTWGTSGANCHDSGGSPWMMEDTGGVRASTGRGRSIL